MSAQSTSLKSDIQPQKSSNFVSIIIAALVAAILASIGTYIVMTSNQNKQQRMLYQQQTTVLGASPTNTSEPTSSVPANWKTYKTPIVDGLGYELKYPPTWKIEIWAGGGSAPNPIELAKIFVGTNCGKDKDDNIRILHFISAKPQQQIVSDTSLLIKDGFKTSQIITGDGKTVVKLTGNPSERTDSYTYVITDKGYYDISAHDYCSTGIGELFDQVVSSFKAIK